MRQLITFIVRLWVEPQSQPPAWEGQVECVVDGRRTHICTAEDLVRFIDTYAATDALPRTEQPSKDGRQTGHGD